MILRNNILSLAATATVLGIASVPAFAFTGDLFFHYTSPNHGTTNGTTVTTANVSVNSVDGDFSPTLVNDAVTFSASTLPSGTSFTLGGYSFTAAGPATLDFTDHLSIVFNSFVPGSFTGPGITTPQTGFLNATFSYVPGSTTLVNSDFTFSTQPGSFTPEPGNVAMLTGMGVSGIGFLVRRRRSK